MVGTKLRWSECLDLFLHSCYRCALLTETLSVHRENEHIFHAENKNRFCTLWLLLWAKHSLHWLCFDRHCFYLHYCMESRSQANITLDSDLCYSVDGNAICNYRRLSRSDRRLLFSFDRYHVTFSRKKTIFQKKLPFKRKTVFQKKKISETYRVDKLQIAVFQLIIREVVSENVSSAAISFIFNTLNDTFWMRIMYIVMYLIIIKLFQMIWGYGNKINNQVTLGRNVHHIQLQIMFFKICICFENQQRSLVFEDTCGDITSTHCDLVQ